MLSGDGRLRVSAQRVCRCEGGNGAAVMLSAVGMLAVSAGNDPLCAAFGGRVLRGLRGVLRPVGGAVGVVSAAAGSLRDAPPGTAMPGAAAVSAADPDGLFLRMRDGMVEAKIETKGDPAAGTAGFLHMLTNWAEILAILRFHTVCAMCQAH